MRSSVFRLIIVGVAAAGASVSVAAPIARHSGSLRPAGRVAPAIATPGGAGVPGLSSARGNAPVNSKSLNSLTGTEHCVVGGSPVPRC
jgi:hypothetical protein